MPAEEIEKASVGVDRVKAVQDQQRASAAAAQDLKLDPVDNQPLGLCHRSFLYGDAHDSRQFRQRETAADYTDRRENTG
jgi:hypothetical protein